MSQGNIQKHPYYTSLQLPFSYNEGERETADISVPSNATFDRLNEIAVGWYRSKAHEAPVAISEVNKRTGIDDTTVSRQNSFFLEIGILAKEGTLFRLTPEGAEYAKYLDFGQLEEAKQVLRKVLRGWVKFQQVLDYLDLKGPLQKDELANRIGLAAEKQVAGGTKTGIFAVIDMLLFSGLVVQQDSLLVLNKEITKAEGAMTTPTITATTPTSEQAAKKPVFFAEFPVRIEFTLHLDSNTDAEKLREFLKMIRDIFSERER